MLNQSNGNHLNLYSKYERIVAKTEENKSQESRRLNVGTSKPRRRAKRRLNGVEGH